MKKPKILLLIPLMLLSPLLAIAPVYAQGTEVCITQFSITVLDCSLPGTFSSTSFTVGSTLTVAVNIQNAPSTQCAPASTPADPSVCAINGFNIAVQADPTVLRGIDVLGANAICIDGQGSCTAEDGLGVVHVLAGGGFGITGNAHLFFIDYKVVGTTGGITIGFATGCSSVTSNPPNCVTLTNGTTLATPAGILTGSFSNLNDFSLAVTPIFQSFLPTSSGSLTVKLAALGLFSGMVTVTNAVSPAGLTCTPASTSVAVPPSQTLTLSCSGSNGTYSVTVTATAATGQTHSQSVTVIVSPPDFLFTANPATLVVPESSSGTSSISSIALSGFSGNVAVSAVATSVAGLSASLSAPTIPAASGSVTLTVSTTFSTPPGTYSVTVTGTSGSLTHTVPIAVMVPTPDFNVVAVPGRQSEVPVGVTASTVVNVVSLNNFFGTVNLNAVLDTSAGIVGPFVGPMNVGLIPTSVFVPAGGAGLSTLTVTNPKNAALGNYTVNISGSSGSLSHSAPFTFTLVDFSANITKTHFVAYQCGNACRDRATIETSALGGNTGWGASEGGSQFLGYNCINNPIAFINPLRPTCVNFQEFYSNGTQVPASVILAGKAPIASFSPRFGFPVPNNSPICLQLSIIVGIDPDFGPFNAFSGNNPGNQTNLPPGSFGFPDFGDQGFPGSTGLPCIGDDFDAFRATAFTQTVPGNYTVFIDVSWSVLDHPIGMVTIEVPALPQITQLHFKHHLSLSKSGNAQTFLVGIFNPNSDLSLNAFVRIRGSTDTGLDHFTVTSLPTLVIIGPQGTVNNIAIVLDLSGFGNTVGLTFSFSVTIVWGPAGRPARALSTTPASPDIPTSGTFTVFP